MTAPATIPRNRFPRLQVRLIQHPVNRGLAAARNTAIRAARNELVASVDADVVADPNWIATLLRIFPIRKGEVRVAPHEGVQTTLADRWRRARTGQEWGPQFLRNPRSSTVQQRLPEIRRYGSGWA